MEKEHLTFCDCGYCDEIIKKDEGNKPIFLVYLFEEIRILVTLFLIIFSFVINNASISYILLVCSTVICGADLLLDTFKNIIKGKIFTEKFLMSIACITAFIIGEGFEGAIIILLFRVGELLEAVATQSSKRQIDATAKMKVSIVHLISKKGINDVLPQEVEIGSLIHVNKGEAVAIDGELLVGEATLDVKPITGESKYSSVKVGGNVFSGSINVGDAIIIKTTKRYYDSVCQKIVKIVEKTQEKKANAQKFITNFAKKYTPIVCILAIIIALIPPLFDQFNYDKWIYKALSLLVISCPCAMVISVPLSFFCGIGAMAKLGILTKNSLSIEKLNKAKCIIFDKTGTLTKGKFSISNIQTLGNYSCEEILKFASILERLSSHPIAKAFSYNGEIIPKDYKEIAGKGMIGSVVGEEIIVGNARLLEDFKIEFTKAESQEVILYLAINRILEGIIYLEDCVKKDGKSLACKLKKQGIGSTVILSGDNESVVKKVSQIVGVDKYYSNLMPEEKLEKLRDIKNKTKGSSVYVGDGINDAPSIVCADVGVAMGAIGSDIAVQNADIVIMNDNLINLTYLISHSKKIMRIVRQNIVLPLVVKALVITLSLLLSMPMWLAMFADVGIMLVAVINSFRCKKLG